MRRSGSWLIVIAVAAVVAFLFLAGPNGLIKLVQMKQREAQLEKKTVSLQAEIELTRQRLQRLASDPAYLRKVAKERLEMIDPHDSLSYDTLTSDSITVDTTASGNDSLSRGSR